VLGAYPAFSKTDDLTSCSRSFDKELLATSDDYGAVNLYRWPCVAPGAPAKTFAGHGPRVAMVRFTPKSDFLASAGETDRCLFQWSRKRNVGPEQASLDDEAAAALAASLAPVGLAPPPEAPEATWKDEVLPPSEDPTAVDAPARAPVLQFAYGVPTTKESVGYNAKGGVAYAAGRLVVAYDGKAHKQVFYEGCTKPISAFAVSADGAYCAAGEWDSVAPLKILDACTLVEVASLPPRLRGAMTRLAFSPCGKFVAAVGTGFGKAQTVCVWSSPRGDWTDGAHLASTPCALRACAFLAFGTAACASAFDVCVGGVGAAVGTPDVVFLKLRGRNLVAADTCVPDGGLGAYLCGVCCGDALLALERSPQRRRRHDARRRSERGREAHDDPGPPKVHCAPFADVGGAQTVLPAVGGRRRPRCRRRGRLRDVARRVPSRAVVGR
jgi:hypothetical protein